MAYTAQIPNYKPPTHIGKQHEVVHIKLCSSQRKKNELIVNERKEAAQDDSFEKMSEKKAAM